MRPYRSSYVPTARSAGRTGFTITELLVAAAISLILTYAVVQMFDFVAKEARYGRASIELAGQLRNASRRISTDLGSATATMRPFSHRHGLGYLEYVEGPGSDGVRMTYDLGPDGVYSYDDVYTPAIRTWATDKDAAGSPVVIPVETSVGGDVDDILMFTAYNPEEPFRGRWTTYGSGIGIPGNVANKTTKIIESKYAEIALWTVRDPNGRVRLYRRVLLIRPDLISDDYYRINAYSLNEFLQENDVSVRYDATGGGDSTAPVPPPPTPVVEAFVGNTMGDLSRRENRFAHVRNQTGSSTDVWPFPHPMDVASLRVLSTDATPTDRVWNLIDDTASGTNNFSGNDVLLNEILAFDVKVYDPTAWVRFDRNMFEMTPSDPGYTSDQGHSALPPGTSSPTWTVADGILQTRKGAFVDLGYREKLVTLGYTGTQLSPANPTPPDWFSGNPTAKSQLSQPVTQAVAYGGRVFIPPGFRTYCTWSSHYEKNNVNENQFLDPPYGDTYATLADSGSNGIDDPVNGFRNGIIDDVAEADTQPPYLNPLPGIQVTLRVMEPNSRQVRQMTIEQSFANE